MFPRRFSGPERTPGCTVRERKMLGKLNAKTQGRREEKKGGKPFLLGIPGAPASPRLCVNLFSPSRCPSPCVAPALALSAALGSTNQIGGNRVQRFSIVTPGQSSVRKGTAGSPVGLERFDSGLSPQAYRTATGFSTCALVSRT